MASRFKVVFVLGGPGSGKGTQCGLIQEKYRFKHLSAGELLRQEMARPNSQFGQLIDNTILQGKIVPSYITTRLLQSAIRANETQFTSFLIDGFPRNSENLMNWKEESAGFAQCPFVLHFRCSKEQMIRRILKRGESSSRSDDNTEVIEKRLKTYYSDTYKVLQLFRRDTKVHQIEGDDTPSKIFEKVCPLFDIL